MRKAALLDRFSGLWRRFVSGERNLFRLRHGDDAEMAREYRFEAPGHAVELPAQDDAFSFRAIIRVSWFLVTVEKPEFRTVVEPLHTKFMEQLIVRARRLSRRIAPDQVRDVEEGLNDLFIEMSRVADLPAGTRWSARAEVKPDPGVQEIRQRMWSRRLEREADRREAIALLDHYEVLVPRCRDLLTLVGLASQADVRAPYLARYVMRIASNPGTASEVFEALSDKREGMDHQLLDAVTQAISNHANVNVLEFSTSYDSALRRLMEWAGLPLPSETGFFADSGSPSDSAV